MLMNDFKGKKIAITRPIERSQEAIEIIEGYGGTALVAPTLELVITNTQPLKDLCKNASELDWLIFTSPTAILSLFKHCTDLKDRLNPNCRIAVIGPRTGKYLSEHGLQADIIPDDYTAEGLLEIFEDINVKNKNIGLPRTLAARDVLPDGLKDKGANVLLVEAYKSDLPRDRSKVNEMVQGIINREVDAVTFTSTLTASNLFEMVEGEDKEKLLEPLMSGEVLVAAIGPVTAKALEKYGIPTITPDEYTVKAMLDKLREEMD
jgi:uroporphyrinogen-III synthase